VAERTVHYHRIGTFRLNDDASYVFVFSMVKPLLQHRGDRQLKNVFLLLSVNVSWTMRITHGVTQVILATL